MRTAQQIREDKEKLAKLQEKAQKLEEKIAKDEKKLKESTKGECIRICLDAIIVGCDGLKAGHGMTAPYTHEFYVNDRNSIVDHEYCRAVTSSTFEGLPEKLYDYLCNKKGWSYEDFLSLKEREDEKWDELPKGYDPAKNFDHVANGYETDGFDAVVKGKNHGTYSTYTTCSQNDLSEELIALKGYCADLYLARHNEKKGLFKEVFERHGLDSDFSDLGKWAKRNPTRCDSDSPHFVSRSEMESERELDGCDDLFM